MSSKLAMFTEWIEAARGSFAKLLTTHLGKTFSTDLSTHEQTAPSQSGNLTKRMAIRPSCPSFPCFGPGESGSIVSHIKGRSQGNF